VGAERSSRRSGDEDSRRGDENRRAAGRQGTARGAWLRTDRLTPDYFAKYIKDEMAKYEQIVKDANIKAE